MIKLKNVILVFKDQLPLKRMFRNFFITGNARGIFHKNSHIAAYSQKPKIAYSSIESARKAASKMEKKNPENQYRAYKCLFCDGYHLGKNRIHHD